MKIDSVCAYCGVGCDIAAEVEGNKIVSISARADGEVSEGKLCVKGKYGFDFAFAWLAFHPESIVYKKNI